ncbi:MAG: hypothetical protein EOL91_10825 [Actinobacteria bacterium]|nr:hypothetical protein [Actinomycetota bacterium]
MSVQLYRMKDSEKSDGMIPITYNQAFHFNRIGYGIFFTPNKIEGRRIADNVKRINYWFADMDEKTKPEQMNIIDKLLYKPSRIVESKRGYHLYWRSQDGTLDNFNKIMIGIIEKLGSDKSVKGANRTMRMPGFYHMKDRKNPFMVKIIFDSKVIFTEKEMLYGFRQKNKKVVLTAYEQPKDKNEMLNPDNWNRIFNLNNICDGCRNAEFTRITFWLRDSQFSADTIRNTVHEMNRRIIEPLPESEINLILKGKI